jgi:signal transduction histidine kinase
LTSFFCESPHESYAFVPDLRDDDRFKDMPLVVREPFVRSLSCVPLRSPKSGVAIGIYAVADDKVRAGPNEEELQFMRDMGLTVMDYLESRRMKSKQNRGEKMVKAIGLFIEGKSTLRESWQELNHMSQGLQRRAVQTVPLERLADAEFGVQDPVDNFPQTSLDSLLKRQTLSRSASSSMYASDYGDERPTLLREQSMVSSTDTSIPSSTMSQPWHERQDSETSIVGTIDAVRGKHNSMFSDRQADQPTTVDALQDVQGTVPSQDLRGVFARASNLIREAIGVEGVVYLDASVASFSGSPARTVINNNDAVGALKSDAILSDNDDQRRNTPIETGEESSEHAYSANDTDNSTERCCEVLGFSTRRRSSLRGHPTSQLHSSFPESLLRRLLRRYPHGKVFYFDEDGQVMTDSDPNASSSGLDTALNSRSRPLALKARRKAQSREAEAKAILKVFPGARSVLWFPLWDVNSDRWSVASLIWSTSPSRALDPAEDSTYLAAFGNSIMAEVAKLSAQVLARMKTDFISSISHELRSPLHGVLASVEFLQETEMTEIQNNMVSNIHASGKVLLDTIDHVLDFSKVNRRSRNKGLLSTKAAKRFRKAKKRDIMEDIPTDEYLDISVLSEEVIESVYAGFRVTKHAFASPADRHLSKTAMDHPVVVIMDIAQRQYTGFDVDPGALRRILMNLFSNAMKYTKSGFIMVTIGIDDGIAPRKTQPSSNLIFKVVDSGKGISQEFLKHRLFKPFEQEDTVASGAGLGLSIIKHIIHDLGGEINFASEAGTGTEVKLRIPLIRMPLTPSNRSANIAPDIITEVKDMTRGLKFSLEGFEYYPDISEPPTGILATDIQAALLLKATTRQILTDWFGMQTITTNSPFEAPNTDVVIVMEREMRNRILSEILEPYSCNRGIGGKKPICIVLCSCYHPTMKTEPHGIFNIFHIQQP